MSEQEGVIKYRLQHRMCALPETLDISELNAWRTLLFQLDLVGCDVSRYQGLGFGNLSCRLKAGDDRFLITGTQTGHLRHLSREDFAIVESASPLSNAIDSCGPARPSSEALTHASVYQAQVETGAVIHVHSPALWRQTQALDLPHISSDIAYGSVDMAQAVQALLLSGRLRDLPLFSMLGHEDGIVAFGPSLAAAACTLLSQLAKAVAIELQTVGD